VRDGEIEIGGSTRPWSWVVVEGWEEREGGFLLRLSINPARGRGKSSRPDRQVIVPVPAAERPTQEEFLAGHAAIAGRSQDVEVDA
jgi:hypothetical protein